MSYMTAPSQAEASRYITLLDITPNVGAFPGFFQIETGRRTVNGFTSDDPLYILRFMKTVEKTIGRLQPQAMQRGIYYRYSLILIDRARADTVRWDEMQALVTDAFMRALQSKSNGSLKLSLSQAERAAKMARRFIGMIPQAARPKPFLLFNEDPFRLLRQSGMHWQLGLQSGMDQTPLRPSYGRDADDYRNDMSLPDRLRNDAWRMPGAVRDVFSEVKPLYIEWLLKRYESGTAPTGEVFSPAAMGAKRAQTMSLRFRGFSYLLDRAFRRLEVSGGPGYIGYGFDDMVREAYRTRLDFTRSDDVRQFVFEWLQKNLNVDAIDRELSLPEPLDRNQSRDPTTMGVIRLRLFNELSPTTPAPDRGTIQVPRIAI